MKSKHALIPLNRFNGCIGTLSLIHICIYTVKHITKPEVVRRLKEIGTHQQQDPRISVAWRSAVTDTKPGVSIYGGKLYKLCSHRRKNKQKY